MGPYFDYGSIYGYSVGQKIRPKCQLSKQSLFSKHANEVTELVKNSQKRAIVIKVWPPNQSIPFIFFRFVLLLVGLRHLWQSQTTKTANQPMMNWVCLEIAGVITLVQCTLSYIQYSAFWSLSTCILQSSWKTTLRYSLMNIRQFHILFNSAQVNWWKNTEINKQSLVKFWLNQKKYGIVSYSLNCT